MNSQDIVEKLQLKSHPEGGFYRETYRSDFVVISDNNENRNVCTAIYYLLSGEKKSLFHRIESDELWFFHKGQPLDILLIQNKELITITLGIDIENGEIPQAVIPANTWFAAKVKNAQGFSLVSCIVSPGFDFSDFELAKRDNLIQQFPNLRIIIEEFT